MSDQLHQAKAMRVQSSAIVMAAMITTFGAVTSALIQTGVTGKPNPTGGGPGQSFAANTSAALSAPIDSATEVEFASAQMAAANTPASLTRAASVDADPPVVKLQPQARVVSEPTKWAVAKPELAVADPNAKPIVSPWYYLAHPDRQTSEAKATKKSFDWGGVGKLIPWLN